MTDWWQSAYPLGPLVAAPGFPRPLYPPDAEGKEPSLAGPDVEAYKRTVWRAGRWPGPASSFDRVFSNAFSHGKSGNVVDTGIAGVQRQQGIDDTGFVGEKTFNALRSIRIPEGLPHAGEPAMDATAQNLVAEAWQMYAGAPSPDARTTREKALETAIDFIGYSESPPASNHTMFGQWYGVDYQPWCAIFASYCFVVGAGGSPSFRQGSAYAYVPYIVADAFNRRNGLSVQKRPIPGDLVCYDWVRDGIHDHVGIFEDWGGSSPSQFTAIEGNTSSQNNSNGGSVMRRTRDTQAQGTVFVRVAEP